MMPSLCSRTRLSSGERFGGLGRSGCAGPLTAVLSVAALVRAGAHALTADPVAFLVDDNFLAATAAVWHIGSHQQEDQDYA